MAHINPHFSSLKREYIFPIIEAKQAEFKIRFPEVEIINLGIGDVALPLAPTIAQAICAATEEMGRLKDLKGYGPSSGYTFLKEIIAEGEFAHLGIEADEIFISDGTNTDTTHIHELFSDHSVVAIMDPTYPAYLDANLLAGKKVIPLPCREENEFCPTIPSLHCDLIYLCSPNNPTGIALTRAQLKKWVDYARQEEAILLFDHAYESFITSPDVPRSLFEIEGAKECAIEFRSFSKQAGFTGLRCAYTVIPKTVTAWDHNQPHSVHALWRQRQSITSNGVSYPIQRGAAAVYTSQGQIETSAQINTYRQSAQLLREGLKAMGQVCYGGIDSPYVWWKTPQGFSSWAFFDELLQQCHLIAVPGIGFGKQGEGFIRLSAFATPHTIALALNRIQRRFAS